MPWKFPEPRQDSAKDIAKEMKDVKDFKDLKDVKPDVIAKDASSKLSRDSKSASTPKEIPKKRIIIPDPAPTTSFDLSSIMDRVNNSIDVGRECCSQLHSDLICSA